MKILLINFIFTSSLAEAVSNGDVSTVKRLLEEGRNVNEVTEDGESLISLAASSGYYELTQVSTYHSYQMNLHLLLYITL